MSPLFHQPLHTRQEAQTKRRHIRVKNNYFVKQQMFAQNPEIPAKTNRIINYLIHIPFQQPLKEAFHLPSLSYELLNSICNYSYSQSKQQNRKKCYSIYQSIEAFAHPCIIFPCSK